MINDEKFGHGGRIAASERSGINPAFVERAVAPEEWVYDLGLRP